MQAQRIVVVDLGKADRSDLDHLVALEQDQPLARQPQQRFPQRGPAEAELLRQQAVVDDGARLQLAAQDHGPHGMIGLGSLRLPLALRLRQPKWFPLLGHVLLDCRSAMPFDG